MPLFGAGCMADAQQSIADRLINNGAMLVGEFEVI